MPMQTTRVLKFFFVVSLLSISVVCWASSNATVFNVPPDKLFAAAMRAAKGDPRIGIIAADPGAWTMDFRMSFKSNPPLSEQFPDAYLHVSISTAGAGKSLLAIAAQKGPDQLSPSGQVVRIATFGCREKMFSEMFLSLVRKELGLKRLHLGHGPLLPRADSDCE